MNRQTEWFLYTSQKNFVWRWYNDTEINNCVNKNLNLEILNGCKAVPIWYKDTVAFIKVNLLPGKFCDTGVLVRVHGFYIQVTKPSLFIPPSFFNLLLVSLQTCSWILVISHVQILIKRNISWTIIFNSSIYMYDHDCFFPGHTLMHCP